MTMFNLWHQDTVDIQTHAVQTQLATQVENLEEQLGGNQKQSGLHIMKAFMKEITRGGLSWGFRRFCVGVNSAQAERVKEKAMEDHLSAHEADKDKVRQLLRKLQVDNENLQEKLEKLELVQRQRAMDRVALKIYEGYQYGIEHAISVLQEWAKIAQAIVREKEREKGKLTHADQNFTHMVGNRLRSGFTRWLRIVHTSAKTSAAAEEEKAQKAKEEHHERLAIQSFQRRSTRGGFVRWQAAMMTQLKTQVKELQRNRTMLHAGITINQGFQFVTEHAAAVFQDWAKMAQASHAASVTAKVQDKGKAKQAEQNFMNMIGIRLRKAFSQWVRVKGQNTKESVLRIEEKFQKALAENHEDIVKLIETKQAHHESLAIKSFQRRSASKGFSEWRSGLFRALHKKITDLKSYQDKAKDQQATQNFFHLISTRLRQGFNRWLRAVHSIRTLGASGKPTERSDAMAGAPGHVAPEGCDPSTPESVTAWVISVNSRYEAYADKFITAAYDSLYTLKSLSVITMVEKLGIPEPHAQCLCEAKDAMLISLGYKS